VHCTRTCSCRTQVPARVVHGFLHGLHDSHWVDSAPHGHPMVTTGSASAPTRPLARAKTTRPQSPLELRLLVLIRASGFEEPVTEHPFAVEGFTPLDARDYGAARVHFLRFRTDAEQSS